MSAPTPFEERPGINALERYFRLQYAPLDNGLCPLEHWVLARQQIPELAGRTLLDDLSDIYEKIERSGHGTRLMAATNLALLQYRFWNYLFSIGRAQRHQMIYWANTAAAWNNRLGDRLAVVRGYRRSATGAIRRASVPPVQRLDVH